MNYYKIDWDYDNLEVIGHYPQLKLKEGYNPSLSDGHWEVNPHEFPDFKPNLELELHKKANPTDYLELITSFGMIVNNKFKKILKKSNLPPHVFYPIKVYHKGDLLNYYWFHYIVEDFWDWLDKDKSKAIIYDDKYEYRLVSEIDLTFIPEKIRKIDNSLPWHQNMKWEKITFKPDFPKYDVYRTQHIDFVNVVSQRLLDALEEAGMTGFTAIPYDKIICE